MAVRAFFSDIGMFVNEWSLVLHVATSTKGFTGNTLEVGSVGREVWVMTIGTGHFLFWNRMVGELGELHFDLCMTAGAEFFLLLSTDFLLRSLVQFVAVEAADIVECMYAGVPAGQVWCRRRRVAPQATHRRHSGFSDPHA